MQTKRITATDALAHPYLDEGRLRYHSCMCKCCQTTTAGRQYTTDFEPVCVQPFCYSFESELTSLQKVRGKHSLPQQGHLVAKKMNRSLFWHMYTLFKLIIVFLSCLNGHKFFMFYFERTTWYLKSFLCDFLKIKYVRAFVSQYIPSILYKGTLVIGIFFFFNSWF